MRYFSEIIPLFEASHYLSQRLSDVRTGAFIHNLEQSGTNISNERWTYFKRIASLESELDEIIRPDTIIERYFTPLKTKASQLSGMPLSIGSVLLAMPPELERPFTYDSLIDYHRNASERARLDQFYERLFPFFSDKREADTTMSGFVAALSDVLVETEDKWAVIDCASNPCEHLETLRPLVTKTMALIEEKALAISDFISAEMEDFCTPENLEKRLRFFYNSSITMENLSRAELYPSIFDFNGICHVAMNDSPSSFCRIIIGLYLNSLYILRTDEKDPSNHVKLLKLLSDPTRFSILHELCDRRSFGQELADKYGGARSAMYYHLEKLFGMGLLDMEMTEYRNLYTMNKQAVYEKMTAMRDYLVNGWKPEE